MSLNLIWRPIKIRDLELKNRVCRTAHSTTVLPTGLNDELTAFHLARARSGVGLSILEAGSVHPNSQIAYLIDEAAMPKFEKMMAAIRPTGMKMFQQLAEASTKRSHHRDVHPAIGE